MSLSFSTNGSYFLVIFFWHHKKCFCSRQKNTSHPQANKKKTIHSNTFRACSKLLGLSSAKYLSLACNFVVFSALFISVFSRRSQGIGTDTIRTSHCQNDDLLRPLVSPLTRDLSRKHKSI